MNKIKCDQDQIILSMHARERLEQRALISENSLLHMLNNLAYVVMHTDLKLKPGDPSPKYLSEKYGYPKSAFLQSSMKCKHMVFWSAPDDSPLIAIVGWQLKQVLTILTLAEYHENHVTQAVTEVAKIKFEALMSGERIHPRYEVLVSWLSPDGIQMRKARAWSKIDQQESDPAKNTRKLIDFARSVCCDFDYDITIYVRSKNEPSAIYLEIYFDTLQIMEAQNK